MKKKLEMHQYTTSCLQNQSSAIIHLNRIYQNYQEKQHLLLEQQRQIYKNLFDIKTEWNKYMIYYKHDNHPRSEWQFSSPLCQPNNITLSESKLWIHTKNQKILTNFTENMKFLCSTCGITLCNKDALTRHYDSQHGLRYECTLTHCNSTFTRKDNFRRHLMSTHDLLPNSATNITQKWTRTTNQKCSTHKSAIAEIQLRADLASRRSKHAPRKHFHTKPVIPGPVWHPRRRLYESTLRSSQKPYEWTLNDNYSAPRPPPIEDKLTWIKLQQVYIDEYEPAINDTPLTPDTEPLIDYDNVPIEIQTDEGIYTHNNLAELLDILEKDSMWWGDFMSPLD